MTKKRIFVILIAITFIITSVPLPAMAAPSENMTEISVSENCVQEEVNKETEVPGTENAMEAYLREHGIINGTLPADTHDLEQDRNFTSNVAAERIARGVSYPEKYDPRPANKVSAVRKQVGGTCWLFAATAAIESNLIHKGLADSSIDLSELQMVYFLKNPYEDPLGYYSDNTGCEPNTSLYEYMTGGIAAQVLRVLGKWAAPVHETEATFYTEQSSLSGTYYKPLTEDEVNAVVLDESLTDKHYWHYKGMRFTSSKYCCDGIEEVKNLITNYGGVFASYYDYLATYYITVEEGGEMTYYNPNGSKGANHAIEIVGWDDNYPKENFAKTPEGDGAWLIKNSWGEVCDYNGVKSNGFLWMSYYETSLQDAGTIEMDCADTYENLYTDPDGVIEMESDDPEKKVFFQSFTAKAYGSGVEKIDGFITDFENNDEYKFTLYVNPILENGEIVSYSARSNTMELKCSFDGHETIDFRSDPLYVADGCTFGICFERNVRSNDILGYTQDIAFLTNKAENIQLSSSISISRDSLELDEGESAILTAEVLPADTTFKNIDFYSTDKNVAVVDASGKVTPTGAGSCEIVATTYDRKNSASCKVTVHTNAFSLSDTTITVGESKELTPVYGNSFLGDPAENYVWSVDDTSLATIDSKGVITGIKKGTVTVSAYLKENPDIKAKCNVIIKQNATGITFGIENDFLYMTEGEKLNLSAQLIPGNADAAVEYIVEGLYGENPIIYENGILTAVSTGSAELTARIAGTEIKEKIGIYVVGPATEISNITLNQTGSISTEMTLSSGEIKKLSFYVTACNTERYREILSATSSNEQVVKVIQKPFDDTNTGGDTACKIQAVGAGTAAVTIKSNDSRGETLVYKITVTDKTGSGNNSSESGKDEVNDVKPATITVNKVVYKFVGDEMAITSAVGNAKNYKLKASISYGGKRYPVTQIAANAFKNHTKLSKITIPSTVVTIGKNAFYGCKKLKAITIPVKVTSIGKKAFYNCKSLKSVTLKGTKLKTIGSSAFKKIKKNATFKVPKKKYKAYKKLLKGKTDKAVKIKKQ